MLHNFHRRAVASVCFSQLMPPKHPELRLLLLLLPVVLPAASTVVDNSPCLAHFKANGLNQSELK